MAATVTFPGVEIMRVGTHPASTGMTTVIEDDLRAMVAASQDDIVDKPPLKIGHTDKRFNAAGDGEPALGWVKNLRISDDGQTLLADYVGVPSKFAQIMQTAWPRRSCEIAWKVPTAAGKVYGAVLTGLALLGVAAPAVKGLADVMAMYSSGELDPIDTDLQAAGFNVIAFSDSDDTPTIPQPIPDSPERVVDQPDSGPDPIMEGAPIVAAANKEKIREALGLKVDATDDEVRAALTEQGITPAAVVEPVADPAASTEPAATDTPVAEPLQTAASAALATVDAAQFSAMQTGYAAMEAKLEAIEAADNKKRRDLIVGTAFSAGKVHPTNVAHFRALLDTDEAGTTALLESMPVMLPVREVGHSDSFSAGTGTDQLTDAQIAAVGASYGLRI